MKIVPACEKYIESYWKTFDKVASEKKYLGVTKGFSLEITRRFIQDSIVQDNPHFFAIENDNVIGWCDLILKPFVNQKTGYLGIGIIENFRKKGIGSALFNKLINKAKIQNYDYIELEVRESNVNAFSIYKKWGFVEIDKVKKGIYIQNTWEDVIKMKYKINQNR